MQLGFRPSIVACAVVVGALASSLASAQQLSIVSVASNGAQADANSYAPTLSDDGRYVAFYSYATTLTPPPHAMATSMYRHDRGSGATICVSSPTMSGALPDYGASCSAQSMSGDGRYVVFWTFANNMGSPDSADSNDVFVRDLVTGQLTFVSVKPNGQGGVGDSEGAVISSDGRFVAFSSEGPNLVLGDNNHREDVFVRDLVAGVTTRVSLATGGAESDGRSWNPSISGDARYVAFTSQGTNLAAGDTNGTSDVFVHDRQTGTTVRVSQTSAGVVGDAASEEPMIALGGRYVVFESEASNLAPPSPQSPRVFLHDLVTGVTSWVGQIGGVADGMSGAPSLSFDGRQLAFRSTSTQLGYPNMTSAAQLFVQDLVTGSVRLVTHNAAGQPTTDWAGTDFVFSADGRFLSFSSGSDDLVAGDANGWADVFVEGGPWCVPAESYCTPGTSANGCVATLSATGSASAGATSGFVLTASGLDGQRQGLFFYGTNGEAAFAWGQSWLCVKAPVQRTGVTNSGGTAGQCDGALGIDWLAWTSGHPGALGVPFSAGDQAWAQAWYRDPASTKATALSDGLRFTLCP